MEWSPYIGTIVPRETSTFTRLYRNLPGQCRKSHLWVLSSTGAS